MPVSGFTVSHSAGPLVKRINAACTMPQVVANIFCNRVSGVSCELLLLLLLLSLLLLLLSLLLLVIIISYYYHII